MEYILCSAIILKDPKYNLFDNVPIIITGKRHNDCYTVLKQFTNMSNDDLSDRDC